jgi:uncharacterized repeat protein (TIGR03843 family)
MMNAAGEVVDALERAELTPLGRLRTASNATILCELPDGTTCVYKPVAGERPLWDFPEGTLSRRELAFAALDAELGVGAVPPTVWRPQGPFGPGMCQLWIDEVEGNPLVDVIEPGAVQDGWLVSFRGEDERGRALELVHKDVEALARIALLDVVANNADRKAGHLIIDEHGGIHAIDHGVCFHVENKLRTVLWGWAATAIPESLTPMLEMMQVLAKELPPSIVRWLSEPEASALRERLHVVATERHFPVPSGEWPAIPWPIY